MIFSTAQDPVTSPVELKIHLHLHLTPVLGMNFFMLQAETGYLQYLTNPTINS